MRVVMNRYEPARSLDEQSKGISVYFNIYDGYKINIKIVITLNTSQVALNGNTATPTMRSDTASETMKVLVGDRSLELLNTAATTSVLPTVTMSAMKDRPARVPNTCASLHTSESRSVWHSVRFIGPGHRRRVFGGRR